MALLSSTNGISRQQLSCFTYKTDILSMYSYTIGKSKTTQSYKNFRFSVKMCSVSTTNVPVLYEKSKRVWIWTESKEVMCAAVERGWNTFIFSPQNQQLASDWSSMALIDPLFIKEGVVFDRMERRVATVFVVSSPQELKQLQPADVQAKNVVIDLLDWQEYFDKTNQKSNLLSLTYQRNFHVRPTGVLDRKTLSKMAMPQHGVADIVNGTNRMKSGNKTHHNHSSGSPFHTVAQFPFFSRNPKWPVSETHLTYAFLPGTRSNAVEPMARAFQTWQARTRFTFSRVEDPRTADLKIGFGSGDHGETGQVEP